MTLNVTASRRKQAIHCALVVLLLLLFPTQQAPPPAQGPPGIPEALGIQPQDPLGAAKILEGVTTREPRNARAWRLLGIALQQAEQFDRAIEAYQKALAAVDVNADGTPEVVATGGGKAHVYSGKDGSRLLALTGEGSGEGCGTSASTAGGVDGDGHADLAVGAWQYGAAAMSGGRIYVHSGKDGRLLRTITGRIPGDTLGFDSVGIGDTDDDGTVDLLVTSASSAVNGYRAGRVFLVSSGIKR